MYDSNGVNRRFYVRMKEGTVCDLVTFLYVCMVDVFYDVVFQSTDSNEDYIEMNAMDSSSGCFNRVCVCVYLFAYFCVCVFVYWKLLIGLHSSPFA